MTSYEVSESSLSASAPFNQLSAALRTFAQAFQQLADAMDAPTTDAPVADVVRGLLAQAGVRA